MARFHRLHRLGNWAEVAVMAALLALGLAAHRTCRGWEASGTSKPSPPTPAMVGGCNGHRAFDPPADGWSAFQIRMTPAC